MVADGCATADPIRTGGLGRREGVPRGRQGLPPRDNATPRHDSEGTPNEAHHPPLALGGGHCRRRLLAGRIPDARARHARLRRWPPSWATSSRSRPRPARSRPCSTAATAAGLVETLKGEGPYTVFAPTDEAFAALPEGTLDGLLADPEALKQILLYHVVAGKVTSDQVVGLTSADSVAGPAIAIAVEDGTVVLNDSAKVVTTDIETSNGVIHVIDAVILPPAN